MGRSRSAGRRADSAAIMARSSIRARFGMQMATDHPGSKPGFRQREPVRVIYPETAKGVPPQHKMARPGLQAVPMRNDVRRRNYEQLALIEGPDGVTRPADKLELAYGVPGIRYKTRPLTSAQHRRIRHKLARQTINPKRQVTRTDLSVSAIEAGGYTLVPEIGSITWSKKVRDVLRPRSRRQQAREAAEASRAKRLVKGGDTFEPAASRKRRDQGRRSS